MSTLAKTKKKPAARRVATVKKFPGLEVSPITGLLVTPLKPGQSPITRSTLKAALADSL